LTECQVPALRLGSAWCVVAAAAAAVCCCCLCCCLLLLLLLLLFVVGVCCCCLLLLLLLLLDVCSHPFRPSCQRPHIPSPRLFFITSNTNKTICCCCRLDGRASSDLVAAAHLAGPPRDRLSAHLCPCDDFSACLPLSVCLCLSVCSPICLRACLSACLCVCVCFRVHSFVFVTKINASNIIQQTMALVEGEEKKKKNETLCFSYIFCSLLSTCTSCLLACLLACSVCVHAQRRSDWVRALFRQSSGRSDTPKEIKFPRRSSCG
jgi:hypothetical protein